MKKNALRLFILLQFLASFAYSEIVVKKSIFSPAGSGFHNLEISSARNTRTGETLIAWQKTSDDTRTSEILVRLVNAKGKPITRPTIITDREGSSFASVAYNAVSDEYVIVYDNSFTGSVDTGSSIFGRHLTTRGQPKGEEVVISNDPVSQTMSNLLPKIVFHPTTGGYALVWLRHVDPVVKQCGLVGTLLSPALEQTGSVKVIRRTPKFPQFPLPESITFLTGEKKLLVPLRQIVKGAPPESETAYFLATLDPLLKKVSPKNVKRINSKSLPFGTHAAVKVAFLPTGKAVLFFVDNNRTVLRRNLDNGGKPSGSERAAFASPKDNATLLNPAVTFAENGNLTQGLLIATERTVDGVFHWAQLLDSQGNPAGAPVEVHQIPVEEGIGSALLSPLPANPGEPLFRFVWFGTLLQADSTEILQLKLTVDAE